MAIQCTPVALRHRPVAWCHQHMDLMPQRREPFGDRSDMDGSPLGARHRLVDGAVQDFHQLSLHGSKREPAALHDDTTTRRTRRKKSCFRGLSDRAPRTGTMNSED